jgi:hypothetical protein
MKFRLPDADLILELFLGLINGFLNACVLSPGRIPERTNNLQPCRFLQGSLPLLDFREARRENKGGPDGRRPARPIEYGIRIGEG